VGSSRLFTVQQETPEVRTCALWVTRAGRAASSVVPFRGQSTASLAAIRAVRKPKGSADDAGGRGRYGTLSRTLRWFNSASANRSLTEAVATSERDPRRRRTAVSVGKLSGRGAGATLLLPDQQS
jgi:hypothetical protein